MLKIRHAVVFAFVVVSFLLLGSCATGRYLKTESARPDEITGTYTLILYGGRYGDDIENVAILFKEGGRYQPEVYAPAFDYKIRKNLKAGDAFEEAQKLVSLHHAFMRSQLSRILDPEGNTIGYEVRPIYRPLDFGFADVLEVYYFIQDNKVVVKISTRYEVERRRFGGDDGPLLFRMR